MPQVVFKLIELSLLRESEREFRLNTSVFSLKRWLNRNFSGFSGG